MTLFGNNSVNNLSTEPPTHPRQDASQGRDRAAVTGTLTKVGGGSKGLDFTRIADDGSLLPYGAYLGSGVGDWVLLACSKFGRIGLRADREQSGRR